MTLWYTWLGFFGLLAGLAAPSLFRVPVILSALTGLLCGVVLVTAWNFVTPTRAPCLPEARGIDILRAYDLSCAREIEERQRNLAPK